MMRDHDSENCPECGKPQEPDGNDYHTDGGPVTIVQYRYCPPCNVEWSRLVTTP